jgi:hypothetical protein
MKLLTNSENHFSRKEKLGQKFDAALAKYLFGTFELCG